MKERARIVRSFTAGIVLISVVVVAIVLSLLNRATMAQQRALLMEMVAVQAGLLGSALESEAIAVAPEPSNGSLASTVPESLAHHYLEGFGRTGEFILARLDEDHILFLVPPRQGPVRETRLPLMAGSQKMPMGRALSGESGTWIGRDYRGEEVLAAFLAVPNTDFAMVAKIDLSEVRAPLLRYGIVASGLALLTVALGSGMVSRITSPMVGHIQTRARELGDARDVLQGEVQERARELEEQRHMLATLVSNLPGMVYRCKYDPSWPFEFVSEGGVAITGYGTHDLMEGRVTGADLIHPDDRDRTWETVRAARARGRAYHLTFRLLRKDGGVRVVQTQGGFLETDPDSIEGFLHDVTEQKKAEESARFLASIVESAELGILTTDLEGKVLTWNQGAEKLTGFPADEVVGSPLDRWIVDEHRDESDTFTVIAQAQVKDGSIVDLATVSSPLRDEHGREIGRSTVFYDITSQLSAQKDLREARRRAQKAEKLASIATLTAGIAHDVGAPMTAILGYAEMMEKSLEDPVNRRRASIIVEQVTRVAGLIEALLNMARPGERDPITFDLSVVVDRALDFYREKLRTRGIEVVKAFEPVPSILGNPDRLQQVFLNLFVNAADAMPSGGRLRVAIRSPAPGQIEAIVADTGTGISPELVERIFEPFVTSKGRGQGTGLGLAVVQSIVENHHGTISVNSTAGSGTEFAMFFEL